MWGWGGQGPLIKEDVKGEVVIGILMWSLQGHGRGKEEVEEKFSIPLYLLVPSHSALKVEFCLHLPSREDSVIRNSFGKSRFKEMQSGSEQAWQLLQELR